jgi:hypothetical protein
MNEPGATGDLHVHHGECSRGGSGKDLGKPLYVLFDVIELGAGHGHGLSLEKFFVEVRAGDSDTVCQEQHIGTLQERGLRPEELQLHRPVLKSGSHLGTWSLICDL